MRSLDTSPDKVIAIVRDGQASAYSVTKCLQVVVDLDTEL
jgi:hypothetical protein